MRETTCLHVLVVSSHYALHLAQYIPSGAPKGLSISVHMLAIIMSNLDDFFPADQ